MNFHYSQSSTRKFKRLTINNINSTGLRPRVDACIHIP